MNRDQALEQIRATLTTRRRPTAAQPARPPAILAPSAPEPWPVGTPGCAAAHHVIHSILNPNQSSAQQSPHTCAVPPNSAH